MALSIYERRRISVLLSATLLVIGIYWMVNRDESKSASSTTTAATTTSFVSELEPITGEPSKPVFIDGPKTTVPTATNPTAYGSGSGNNRLTGFVTFHRFSDDTRGKCHTEEVPLGITITVTNVNTGRSTTCFNVAYLPPPAGSLITLNTLNYLLIGELADAPLPVEISW